MLRRKRRAAGKSHAKGGNISWLRSQIIDKIAEHGGHARKPGHLVLLDGLEDHFRLESRDHDNTAAAVEAAKYRAGVGENVNQRQAGNRYVRFLQPIVLGRVSAPENQVPVGQHDAFGPPGGP